MKSLVCFIFATLVVLSSSFLLVEGVADHQLHLFKNHNNNNNKKNNNIQQKAQLNQAWSLSLGSNVGTVLQQSCSLDSGKTFFIVDSSNNFIRARSSDAMVLWNVTVSPGLGQYGNHMIQYTSSASGNSYVAIQHENAVHVYSYGFPTSTPQPPTLILQVEWHAQSSGISTVILTEYDTLLVPYLEQDGKSYQLRAYDINPNSPNTDRTKPIYATNIQTMSLAEWAYAGGVVSIFELNSAGRTQAVEAKSGKILWQKSLGDGLEWDGMWSAREAGLFFNIPKVDSMTLQAIQATTGNIVFTFPLPTIVNSISSVASNPRLVRLNCADRFILLDGVTGAVVRFIQLGGASGGYSTLLGDTVALAYDQNGNNTLWSLTQNNTRVDATAIPWQCYRQHMPVRMICNRPAISAQASFVNTYPNPVIFSVENPSSTYFPIAIDGIAGAIIASNSAAGKFWQGSPSVLNVDPTSGVAVYTGTGPDNGGALVGYSLQ